MLKVLEPWWVVQIGYVTEDDIRVSEKSLRRNRMTLFPSAANDVRVVRCTTVHF